MILDGVDSTSEVSAMSYLVNQFSAFLKNTAGHSCMSGYVFKLEVLTKKS